MKYFFFDIDGTLKPYYEKISKSTKDTIKKLIELGNVVFLATGRRENEIRSIMKELNINNAVCAGGGTIIIDNKIENEVFFDKSILKNILEECEKYNIIMVNVSGGECYTTYKGIKIMPYILFMKLIYRLGLLKIGSVNCNELTSYINVKFVGKSELLNKKTQKIIFYNDKKINRVQSIKGYTLYNNKINTSIEFEFKERGIDYIRKKYDLSLDDIIVFGDGINDIGMFKYAKNSIAMGNACKEIKSISSFVTKDVKEDGIEYACRKFKWI